MAILSHRSHVCATLPVECRSKSATIGFDQARRNTAAASQQLLAPLSEFGIGARPEVDVEEMPVPFDGNPPMYCGSSRTPQSFLFLIVTVVRPPVPIGVPRYPDLRGLLSKAFSRSFRMAARRKSAPLHVAAAWPRAAASPTIASRHSSAKAYMRIKFAQGKFNANILPASPPNRRRRRGAAAAHSRYARCRTDVVAVTAA
jgi:hypothetical protein